jgi:hydrogenase/urease accessory protein HupE
VKIACRSITLATLIVVAILVVPIANADEARPGYLQLTLEESDKVALVLKVPAIGNRRFGLYPALPENCVAIDSPVSYIVNNAYTERVSYLCEGGLTGRTIGIDGLTGTMTDVLARVERPDGTTQVARLTPSSPTFVVTAVPDMATVAITYLKFGTAHILSGNDHLLFVLALLILVTGTRTLIWTITAFTVAHSITLAAAALGLVVFPQAPVEAVIALSIVFVASEIIHASNGRPGLTQRRPWVIAFTFGLLHGFGFAGALTEVGLPEQAVPLALLFFNLGVELGQLMFVGAILMLIALGKYLMRTPPRWLPVTTAYAIGIIASYWTIERVVSFL